jgi:CMP-N-acetylneuraminic acid synthetase/quercetin dioxygenase-like cupin family protein
MKKIAVIPILLGSKRIKDKNLLLVDGEPLVNYALRACIESKAFDDIYINSEHDIFKKVADNFGVKFYKRKSENGGTKCTMKNHSADCKGERCQVHDHYLYDFISNIEADYYFQVHTTSPLIKSETIKKFVNLLCKSYTEKLFAIEEIQKESFCTNEEINFDMHEKTPTQEIDPIQQITWALFGFERKSFINDYKIGPTFTGNIDFFPINKIEAIDIDTEEDLFIAEACLNHLKRKENKKFYYNDKILSIERDLESLIKKDGSPLPTRVKANLNIQELRKIKKKMGNGSWCYPLVLSDNDQATLIQQVPGEGCRKHYHTTKDEWWVVLEGKFEWRLDDRVIHADEKDFIYLPKGTTHQIVCVSDKPSIRLAAGERFMSHVYI